MTCGVISPQFTNGCPHHKIAVIVCKSRSTSFPVSRIGHDYLLARKLFTACMPRTALTLSARSFNVTQRSFNPALSKAVVLCAIIIIACNYFRIWEGLSLSISVCDVTSKMSADEELLLLSAAAASVATISLVAFKRKERKRRVFI